MLSQEQAQQLCDKWANLFKIGSWKFTVELKDNDPVQFRYNTQEGTAVLEITYSMATEEKIVSMLTDFSMFHRLLPQLFESGDQYIDYDDRNIKEIVNVIMALNKPQDELCEVAEENKYGAYKYISL